MELWRRNLILISGFLEALLFVGCLFGWPSLLLILEKEGVYQHVCNTPNLDLDETSEPVTTCAKQKVDLTFVYTTAAVLYGVIGVFVGMTLEVLGLRKTRMIGISLICGGFVFLAYTTPEHWYLIWPALNFIAVGSIILRFSGFLYAELWPKYKATIMTSYSAGYAISCSSFILVQILYEWNFSMRLLCLCCGGICAITFIPTSMITKEIEDICKGKRSTQPEIERTDPDPDEKEAMSPLQPLTKENGDVNSNMISSTRAETSLNPTLSMKLKLQESWKSICNLSGVLHAYWHFINFYLMLFYSSTFNLWAEDISSKDVAYYIKISGLFSFLGPFVTPCTGYAIDVMKNRAESRTNELERIGHRMQAATYPMVASSILIGLTIACKLFNTETAIYLSMVLIALSRPAVVGCCMAYIKLRFPEDQFNMLNGIFTTFISLLCFVQYPVSKWMVQSEQSYMHVHVLVVSMLFLSLVSPIHMMIPKVMMKYARERRRTDSLRVINQNHVEERRGGGEA